MLRAIAGIGIALAMLLYIGMNGALGHENPTDWIGQERRTNDKNEQCCGKGDCFPFTAQQMKITPEGYTFPDGHFVPFSKAAPSADGFFWKCVWGGETKCVFAPIGGV